jgi:hypothetical protein
VTLHIVYDHQCPNCQAFYIPYDTDVPCPRCGLVEAERFDYIPQAAASAQFNMQMEGSYVPAAWWIGSLGDHILQMLFNLLEHHRTNPAAGQTFEQMTRESLARANWGNQQYLHGHVYGIAMRVYEELNNV